MSYTIDTTFGCHIWTGALDKDGYGVTSFRGKRAHQAAWERANGPVPDGLVIEHRCSRRRCCFVPHLELVTQSENLYRRAWKRRVREQKCPNGHDMRLCAVTPEKGRLCRVCQLGARNSQQGAER